MADILPGTLGPLLREARQRLAAAGVADPTLDARLLVEHFSGTTRTQAIAEP
ncbi:protein-(glutamine-N5) methyltransferase, release factor-specific, partial [Mesorhizobium sp. M4A.F.Ca.ET.020.02.1.1]